MPDKKNKPNAEIQKHIESKVFDKMTPIKNPEPKFLAATQMQGSPFKLGSNRGNNSYSSFQAKGLISPMANKTERDKDYDRKKKAAELTFTTRLKESGLSLDEFKKTKEGAQLAKDVQTVESQRQGYGG
tara:strand:+ start:708 stop:1094 length:387 start_codon:yes stop_codon:yes gene_type:complete